MADSSMAGWVGDDDPAAEEVRATAPFAPPPLSPRGPRVGMRLRGMLRRLLPGLTPRDQVFGPAYRAIAKRRQSPMTP